MLKSVRGPGRSWVLSVAFLLVASPAWAAGVDAARLRTAAVAGDWKQIQAMGTGTLPALARLY